MRKRCVYQMTNNLNNKIYIGSTSNPENRWNCFKLDSYVDQSYPMAQYIRANGGHKNFTFKVMKERTCDKDEIRREEQKIIDAYNVIDPTIILNQRRAYNSEEKKRDLARIYENKQYRTRPSHRAKKAAYYKKHREKIRAAGRKRYAERLAKSGKVRKNTSAYLKRPEPEKVIKII